LIEIYSDYRIEENHLEKQRIYLEKSNLPNGHSIHAGIAIQELCDSHHDIHLARLFFHNSCNGNHHCKKTRMHKQCTCAWFFKSLKVFSTSLSSRIEAKRSKGSLVFKNQYFHNITQHPTFS
jgi:hypothetical protein